MNKDEFNKDSDELRCKLLDWRLKNYDKIDTEAYKEHLEGTVSKRLNEMFASLICIRSDDQELINLLKEKEREDFELMKLEQSMSLEADIIRAIDSRCSGYGKGPSLSEVALAVSPEGKNYDPRTIGKIVRKKFNLRILHTNSGNQIKYDKDIIEQLKKEYYIPTEESKRLSVVCPPEAPTI